MIKNIFFGFSLLMVFISFAQNTSVEQTISLLGEATKKVNPDVAMISFSITGKDKEENVALTKLNTQTQQVIDKLALVRPIVLGGWIKR